MSVISVNNRIKQMRMFREDAHMCFLQGHFDASAASEEAADFIEDDLRTLAYINACESDSPNSPDFENVLNAELRKLGIED